MATNSSVQWRSGNSICRCCLSEGCYKDISTEYFWMGKREVYSEMLAETFDLCISFSKNGGPNSNSRLICEACISRLRDAAEFKRQVKDCEKTFVQLLEPGSSQDTSTVGKEIKKELKLENLFSDDDDDDFLDDTNDFGDDDLDDEPLMKLASKTPKKEPPVQLKSVLSKGQIGLKRKAPAPVVQSKSTPPKKVKIEVKKVSATTSSAKNPEKPKKGVTVQSATIQNANLIVKHSSAHPFTLRDKKSICCCYCFITFEDPDLFRHHMTTKHKRDRLNKNLANVKCTMRVDVVNLSCRICQSPFQRLEPLAQHLKDIHSLNLDTSVDLGLIQIKLIKDKFDCFICDKQCIGYNSLYIHAVKHTSGMKHICEVCAGEFLTHKALSNHMFYKHAENSPKIYCRKCKCVFKTLQERKEHHKISKNCLPVRCSFCIERFSCKETLEKHVVDDHGKPATLHTCPNCKQNFKSRTHVYFHFNLVHSDKMKCKTCDQSFKSPSELQSHMNMHTGVKAFQCDVCDKAFHSGKSLMKHKAIHDESRKVDCPVCGKRFTFKWKVRNHLKSQHPEYSIP